MTTQDFCHRIWLYNLKIGDEMIAMKQYDNNLRHIFYLTTQWNTALFNLKDYNRIYAGFQSLAVNSTGRVLEQDVKDQKYPDARFFYYVQASAQEYYLELVSHKGELQYVWVNLTVFLLLSFIGSQYNVLQNFNLDNRLVSKPIHDQEFWEYACFNDVMLFNQPPWFNQWAVFLIQKCCLIRSNVSMS